MHIPTCSIIRCEKIEDFHVEYEIECIVSAVASTLADANIGYASKE